MIRKIESWKYLDRDIWDPEHGSQLIYQACQSGLPQAIGKLGSVELGAIRKYLRWCNHPQREELTALDRQILYTNAGVFPNDCHMLESFSVFMTRQVLPELTLIGVWFNLGEANVVKRYALATRRIAITSFESYWITQQPWTKALQGKRVLVVHPFEATIRAQYPYRLKIWMGREDVLPKFELLTMKVPQSPALITPRHASWFEALEDMQQQMSAVEFDIALIGAGAYSLPLAVHAKKLGKQGIHLGGATQIFFGIKGGRWDVDPVISQFYNEHWIRPLPEDTPPHNTLIEGGTYW